MFKQAQTSFVQSERERERESIPVQRENLNCTMYKHNVHRRTPVASFYRDEEKLVYSCSLSPLFNECLMVMY